ncbi:MAG: hypothetical protein ACE5KW_01840 [Dehalococcoidia bacterium]
MAFGTFGRGDKQSMVIERSVEQLAVEAPHDASGDRLEDRRPAAEHGGSEASQGNGRGNGHVFLIVQRNGNGAPVIHHRENAREAQIFLEALLTDGINREDVEIFHASKVAFNVRFRPVVALSLA